MSEALTPAESVRLIELERVIERGKSAFLEVGKALREIRESRLYRASGQTFEEYFRERLGLEKSYVKYLMDAAQVVENLKTSTIVEVPKNESQTRPLAKLPAEQQPVAWEKAVAKAEEEGKPVTARHVEEAVAEVSPAPALRPKEERAQRVSPYQPDLAEDCWMHARMQLDRIHQNDMSREKVLREVVTYCESRISEHR